MGNDIPVTYVPARNTIFLSLCLGWAEAAGARDLFIGVNALDYSGYPDCRPEFIAAFEAMANLATKAGVEGDRFTVHAPLIDLTKADIVREAARLGLDAGMSWSCYDPTPDRRALRPVRFLPAARQGLRRGRARRSDRLCAPGRRRRMSYAVKEIFLTLQGEGMQAGRRAVFLRFAGCNLWTRPRAGPGERAVHLLRHRFRRHGWREWRPLRGRRRWPTRSAALWGEGERPLVVDHRRRADAPARRRR